MLKKIVLICTALMLTLSVTACSGGAKNPEAAAVAVSGDSNKTLYFIPIVDTGAYWSLMKIGAVKKAEELGYELIVKTSPPSENQKNEKHLGFLQEAIMHGAAAIAIAPMDPSMFDRRVAEAKNANIPVVTFDADILTTGNRVAYVGTDNYLAGVALGKHGAEYLLQNNITSGSIALVATNLTQTTMLNRQKGIKDGLEEVVGADAANFKWLEAIIDDDQSSVSKQQLEGQIVGNPDMKVVFTLGSEGPDVGVMEALKSQKKAGEIAHFGFDYTPTWENGIDNKLITGIVDQNAYNIGVTVVQAMVDAVEGREVKENYAIDVEWITADQIVEYGKQKQAMMEDK